MLRQPQSQGTEGCRGGNEVLETSGAEDLKTSEPESQVPQVPVEQDTESLDGP